MNSIPFKKEKRPVDLILFGQQVAAPTTYVRGMFQCSSTASGRLSWELDLGSHFNNNKNAKIVFQSLLHIVLK